MVRTGGCFDWKSKVRGDSPGCLAEIGTLARGLEVGPLLEVERLGRRGVGQRVELVVSCDEVGHDGSGFP